MLIENSGKCLCDVKSVINKNCKNSKVKRFAFYVKLYTLTERIVSSFLHCESYLCH